MGLSRPSDGINYIARNWRVRWDVERVLARLLDLRKGFPEVKFIVENQNVGISIISALRLRKINALESNPTLTKLERAAKVLSIFVDEFLVFPRGHHDDCVDSVAQILPWLSRFLKRPDYGQDDYDRYYDHVIFLGAYRRLF